MCATVTVTVIVAGTGNSSGERVRLCIPFVSLLTLHINTKIIQLTCQNAFDEVICVMTVNVIFSIILHWIAHVVVGVVVRQ